MSKNYFKISALNISMSFVFKSNSVRQSAQKELGNLILFKNLMMYLRKTNYILINNQEKGLMLIKNISMIKSKDIDMAQSLKESNFMMS